MPHSSIVINKKILGAPPIVQSNSLLFPGNAAFSSITDDTVGLDFTWSIVVWAKDNEVAVSTTGLFAIELRAAATPEINAITLRVTSAARDDLLVSIKRDDGNLAQLARWNDLSEGGTDTWVQYVVTWGGDAGTGPLGLKVYTQGIDRGARDVNFLDQAHSPSSPDTTDTPGRSISVGIGGSANPTARWKGPMYSAAVYNSILSASEVTAIYNEGNARDFDLEKDHSGYTSSGSLLHYFRLGVGTTELEFGTDHTAIPNDLSMDHRTDGSGQAFDSDDLVTDIPDGT